MTPIPLTHPSVITASAEGSDSAVEQVKAGTLNKLVERLTSAKGHDYMYVKTFLLTYQSFTTPTMFFQKLEERYACLRVGGWVGGWMDECACGFNGGISRLLI